MRPLTALTALTVSILLAGCSTATESPKTTPIDAASNLSLVNDAQALSRDLTTFQAETGAYPDVAAPQVAATTQTPLTPGNVVQVYTLTATGPVFCVANSTSGDWVRMDVATGASTSATPGSPLCGQPGGV